MRAGTVRITVTTGSGKVAGYRFIRTGQTEMPKSDQTITFDPISDRTALSVNFDLNATASSMTRDVMFWSLELASPR